jgi:hypothetical protein
MHHFIYPSQDTFITNTVGLEDLNFGLDEILRVGTETITVKSTSPTTTIPIFGTVLNLCVSGFSGSIVNSSIYGTASFASGVITSSIDANVTASNFNGILTGSYLSSSLLSGSAFTGSLTNFSGSFTGIFSGSVSGYLWTDYLQYFNGNVIGFTGQIISGSVNGADILPQQNTTISDIIYDNRALVQFDITAISQSIASRDIVNPEFRLKLKVAREFELPIQYHIYAFPISESWVMGNGYVSDNGSSQGANWIYRDYDGGTPWATTGSSYISSLSVTQSFNYQVGDINVDVTPIVNAWVSGTVPNNGIVLISGDEFAPTSSGMSLYFFSKDTNTIYEPILDVGWSDFSWSTGSIITSSANISTIPAGISGSVSDSGSISGFLFGCFTGFGNMSFSSSIDPISGSSGSFITNSYASGIIQATGLSGLITSMSINGDFVGMVSSSTVCLISTCSSCIPNFYSRTGDSWVIDGQFPSMYSPYPNVPGFVQEGLAYLNQGQNQSQYEGHDIYGWGDKFNEFNQYDWTSDHVFQEEFGPGSIPFFVNKGCNCNPTQQGAIAYSYSSSLYNCATGDPCIQSAIDNTTCLGPCNPSLSITISLIMGTFTDGIFSGSVFTSSFCDGYLLGRGFLIGNWNESMIDGTIISSSYPSSFPSGIVVTFDGNYFSGSAFGSVTELPLTNSYSTSSYGIFSGVFINGLLAGYKIYAPFSGSIMSSSYSYTSSLNTTSSVINPVNVKSSFATVIQNVPSSVTAGDIIKVNVFARPEFPLKNFDRQTQFTQFLIPQYLPTSSYYAIKDNETEEMILDFDQYTQLSCNLNGNYFMLDTTSFPQERYFKILVRVEQSGSVYTLDHNNIFKIVR